MIKNIYYQEFNRIKQILKKLFVDFYCAFIKHSIFCKNKNILLNEIKKKVNLISRKVLLLLFENFILLLIIVIAQQNNENSIEKLK